MAHACDKRDRGGRHLVVGCFSAVYQLASWGFGGDKAGNRPQSLFVSQINGFSGAIEAKMQDFAGAVHQPICDAASEALALDFRLWPKRRLSGGLRSRLRDRFSSCCRDVAYRARVRGEARSVFAGMER